MTLFKLYSFKGFSFTSPTTFSFSLTMTFGVETDAETYLLTFKASGNETR